ncbi:MAG TPA: FAD-dependent oxidoreductase [Usitatibacter sp.]|nr:FAD-dependent oxidoreductase [Usitatibacter sp.]
MKRLVLLGGGHAHVEVLRDLAERPVKDVEVSVVTPYSRLIYTGMVPGVIAGHYALADSAIDVAALCRAAGATLMLTSAARVRPNEREVSCSDGSVLAYDVLSLDVGSVPVIGGALGVERNAVRMRPMEALVRGWADVRARAKAGKVGSITVVGAGAAGVELALAMDYGLRREMKGDTPHVRIIADTPVPLPELHAGARSRLRRRLARRNIGVHVSSTVKEVGERFVRLQSGIEFASDATFWATGAGAQEWIRESGFATDERGFLLTNDFLQSVTYREVFGVGDCATQEHRPLPKAGVFAVRAAPQLAANLRAALSEAPLERHVASPRHLQLVSCGGRYAVGLWNGYSWQGYWAWLWKDRIDRGFVARYRIASRPVASPALARAGVESKPEL